MRYSLTSAGKATGLSKSTIYRAVKSGKVTAKKNDEGEYEIDAAELFRVFEPVSEDAAEYTVERSVAPHDTDNEAVTRQMKWMKDLNDEHNRQLREANERAWQAVQDKEDAIKERDEYWQEQLNEMKQLLLAAPSPRKKFLGIF